MVKRERKEITNFAFLLDFGLIRGTAKVHRLTIATPGSSTWRELANCVESLSWKDSGGFTARLTTYTRERRMTTAM